MNLLIALITALNVHLSDNGRQMLLANDTHQSWYLSSFSTNETPPACELAEEVTNDNIYTFHANGTFEFSNGTVTEKDSCDHCCTDLVSYVGKWEFTKKQRGLRVTALYEKDNQLNELNVVVFDAAIQQIDDQVLILTQDHPKTKIRYTFEFRKK